MKKLRLLYFTIIGILIFSTCQKPNTPPIALFTITPDSGNIATVFIFDASECSDIEEATPQLQVRWDFETDGTWDTQFSTIKTVSKQFIVEGIYRISLEVKDSEGMMSSVSIQLNVTVSGTFIDSRDGKTYCYGIIGNQTWMVENLAYLPYVSNSDEGSKNNPIYYVHGYEGNSVILAKASYNYEKYGVLYNWEAAKTACPSGWHLPSDYDWKTLERYLGMSESEANDIGWRGTDEGNKLKSTSGWNNNGNGTNESGFSALAGGYRDIDGYFYSLGGRANFWSSTESSTNHAWYRRLSNGYSEIYRYDYDKKYGFSVRCVRDN